MKIYLIDGTYELFRSFYGAPEKRAPDGREVGATLGVLRNLLSLLMSKSGATHVACAFDHVVESFRNELFPGYKTSEGIDPNLLSQFPLVEEAVHALGLGVWPMVEFEADDAIAAAAVRFAEDRRVERILVCTPDKDMAQLVRDERIVLWDRRRGIVYDDAGVRAKWGVGPTSIPDYLAVVGDSSDGYPGLPGWGAKSAAAVLARYESLEAIPRQASAWEVPGVGGTRAIGLASTLAAHWDEAMLYRDLARLRTASDGVQVRQTDVEELRWEGAPRVEWEAFCDEWGLDRLAARPHRWRAEDV